MIKLLGKILFKNTEDSDLRRGYGILCGSVGIVLNLLLCTAKILVGYLSSSLAIAADGFNNLSDAGSSIVTLAGFKLSGKRADTHHPFGHGRAEYLSALIVSFLIIIMGFELGKSSVESLISKDAAPVFTAASFIALGVSILVKLYMAFYNTKYGKKYHSSAMAATARDSLFDVITTFAVLLSAIFNALFQWNIDAWCGLLVSVMILIGGVQSASGTVTLLLGTPADKELIARITETVLAHPGILGVHDLIVHDYGPGNMMITLHAEVADTDNLVEAHDLIDNIEWELNSTYHCVATIHMDPIAIGSPETEAARVQVQALVQCIDPRITVHDLRLSIGPTHTKLVFDAAAPYDLGISDEELRKRLVKGILALDPNFVPCINIDRIDAK